MSLTSCPVRRGIRQSTEAEDIAFLEQLTWERADRLAHDHEATRDWIVGLRNSNPIASVNVTGIGRVNPAIEGSETAMMHQARNGSAVQ